MWGLVSLTSSSYPSPCFSYSSEIIVLGGGRGVWFASFSRKLSEPEDGRYRPKHVVLSLEWCLQHRYHSNPTTSKLQHTLNQEQYDQCGNSTE